MESAIAVTAAIHSHNIVNDSKKKKKTNKIVKKNMPKYIQSQTLLPKQTNQKEAHAKIKPTEKNALK